MRGMFLVKSFHSAEAALNSYYPRLRRFLRRDGRYVVLSAMPKSGSTFLSRALAQLLGYRHAYFAFAYQNIEQELYLPRVLDAYGDGTVVQQHFKANDPNLDVLRQFGIRPVVLTRNILDVVVSTRDHLLRERLDNIPSLYPSRSFREFDPEEQLDFVATFFGPWLVAYYVSWVRAQRERKLDLLWLRYEDCVRDWPAALEAVLAHAGLAATRDDAERALDVVRGARNTRLNKGVPGRGATLLSYEQQERVRRMTEFYPDIDFSPVGVPTGAGVEEGG